MAPQWVGLTDLPRQFFLQSRFVDLASWRAWYFLGGADRDIGWNLVGGELGSAMGDKLGS